MRDIDKAKHLIANSQSIVFFTGAGVSAESGIATFRDASGLWAKYNPALFASVPGIAANLALRPRMLANFLHDVLMPIVLAEPNQAHRSIADLQKRKKAVVITQNVDGLHQRAGSQGVIEVHGSFFEAKRLFAKAVQTVSKNDLVHILESLAALQSRRLVTGMSVIRSLKPLVRIGITSSWFPNLTLFGQALPEPAWSNACKAAKSCDCMIVVGTSLRVYPAASLVDVARSAGARILQIDPGATQGRETIPGDASAILPLICADYI